MPVTYGVGNVEVKVPSDISDIVTVEAKVVIDPSVISRRVKSMVIKSLRSGNCPFWSGQTNTLVMLLCDLYNLKMIFGHRQQRRAMVNWVDETFNDQINALNALTERKRRWGWGSKMQVYPWRFNGTQNKPWSCCWDLGITMETFALQAAEYGHKNDPEQVEKAIDLLDSSSPLEIPLNCPQLPNAHG